jgi:hypothetical protein
LKIQSSGQFGCWSGLLKPPVANRIRFSTEELSPPQMIFKDAHSRLWALSKATASLRRAGWIPNAIENSFSSFFLQFKFWFYDYSALVLSSDQNPVKRKLNKS